MEARRFERKPTKPSPFLKWVPKSVGGLWRAYSDKVNGILVERWLAGHRCQRILKTDAFDEASHLGLTPHLNQKASAVVGMDVSHSVLAGARRRHSSLSLVQSDVRILPFLDGSFDAIVSISTLDHFPEMSDIRVSLLELNRILRPGGRFILTMDNLMNPVVRLRNALPFKLLRATGVVPYYVGVTLGPRKLVEMVKSAGFEIEEVTSLQHFPRVLAVVASRLIGHSNEEARVAGPLRMMARLEKLDSMPTRFLTGYFVGVKAVKF